MRRLLFLPAAALVAPLFLAPSAAHAATVVDFTINGTSEDQIIAAGTTVPVTWEATSAADPAGPITITPGGTAVGAVDGWTEENVAAAENATVDVTIPAAAEPGTVYTFEITATEPEASDTSDVVSITVAASDTLVTPAPVVVDGCDLVVPDSEGVVYTLLYGLDDEFEAIGIDLEPGAYSLAALGMEEGGVVVASPKVEFVFADDALTEFEVPAVAEECYPTFVETEPVCRGLIITNVTDAVIDVLYGGLDEDEAEGDFSLEPGESATVSTDHELVLVVAGEELLLGEAIEEELVEIQFELVEVDQNCSTPVVAPAKRPSHPTVAPAAGA